MDPVTISMGLTLAAGAVSAAGSMFSGAAAKTAANYQAGIAQQNAAIANQNAAFETAKGEVEAQQVGMKGRYQRGEALTTQAASGMDVNRGSNVNVRSSMADITSLNEATIRNSAARKAWGYEVEAAGDEANAALDRMKGSAAQTAGEFSAGASILGSASSVAGQWSKASQQGWKGPSMGGSDFANLFGFGDSDWDKSQKQGLEG
jgi:hypothetical protein